MREIWQQDVLRYLTNRRKKNRIEDPGFQYGLHLPLKNVRLELGLIGENGRLSSFVNRNKNIGYMGPFNAVDIVGKLIHPKIESGAINPKRELHNFHEFLRVEGIEDKWLDIQDYEQCLIAAFSEGLPRRFPTESIGPSGPGLRRQRLMPTPFFTGREMEISRIRDALKGHGAVVLSGVGGIGKTVLAEEYARRSADRYTSCQVVTSEPSFTSYEDLLRQIRFDAEEGDDSPGDDSIETVMERLCDLNDSSLLILDNIDKDLDDYGLLRRLLRDSGTHIIITTRMPGAFPEGSELVVDSLPDDEQLLLLKNSMGRDIQPEELEAAREICRRVDGHTLLVQLLGRAIRTQGITCSGMLRKLQGLTGFEALSSSVRVHKDDFNKSVRIRDFVSEILFDLEPLSEATRDMLRFLTLLPLEGVPLRLLITSPFTLDESALNTLIENGWLISSPDEDIIRVHSVIREAILSELHVDSNTCTPFLDMLAKALWEPEVTPDLPYLLRMASTALDMLYISDDLRELLLSDRLNYLYESAYSIGSIHDLWMRLADNLNEMSHDEELTPYAAATLRMYALFCEYMSMLDNERIESGIQLSALPFIETGLPSDTADRNHLEEVIQEFLELFISLHEEYPDNSVQNMWDKTPEAFLQAALAITSSELSEYLSESGLAGRLQLDPHELASVFSSLSAREKLLLESVSQHVFGSFAVTALEALAHFQSFSPFAASTAVGALTILFSILQLSSEQMQSFEQVSMYRGWVFPKLTYIPKGYEAGLFSYTEELWGRPAATQFFVHGKKRIIVSMRLIDVDLAEFDEFQILESHEVERLNDRVILARGEAGTSVSDLQVEIGSWRVRITSPDRVSQKELLKTARGLQVPEETLPVT